jgi:hypothetical protein
MVQDGAPPHCHRNVTNYLILNLKISGLADTVSLCGHLGLLTLIHWIFIFEVILNG